MTDDSAFAVAGGDTDLEVLGTLVITVWRESGHFQPFRARLSSRTDDDAEPTIIYAASQEAVLGDVKEWLQGLPQIQQ